MPAPGTLIQFSPNTLIKSADVNTNGTTLRTSLLTAAFVDTANAWTISQPFSAGITVSGAATFSSGVVTFSSGVTFASGTTVTASGLTVAGGVAFSGAPTITGPLTVTGASSFVGNVTCGAALNVVGVITATGTANAAMVVATLPGAIATCAVALNNDPGTGLYFTTATVSGMRIAVSGSDIIRFNNALIATPQKFYAGIAITSPNPGLVVGLATLSTAATVGFLYIPTMAATASGTPVAEAGTVPLAYETGGNHLMVFAAGVWKQVALA